jgi:hypothetical protein
VRSIVDVAVMVVGVLEQHDHVAVCGIVAHAIDEAAMIDRLAGEVGKINRSAILHVHSLSSTWSNNAEQQNQRECQPFHYILIPVGQAFI